MQLQTIILTFLLFLKSLFLIIIIIIMSCRHHGYPWPSFASSPDRSSPLAGLQVYIPNRHLNAVCMIELVVLFLQGHMWGSIGVHHLWARPCFSSSNNLHKVVRFYDNFDSYWYCINYRRIQNRWPDFFWNYQWSRW